MLERYDKKLSETSNKINELDKKINKMIKKEIKIFYYNNIIKII